MHPSYQPRPRAPYGYYQHQQQYGGVNPYAAGAWPAQSQWDLQQYQQYSAFGEGGSFGGVNPRAPLPVNTNVVQPTSPSSPPVLTRMTGPEVGQRTLASASQSRHKGRRSTSSSRSRSPRARSRTRRSPLSTRFRDTGRSPAYGGAPGSSDGRPLKVRIKAVRKQYRTMKREEREARARKRAKASRSRSSSDSSSSSSSSGPRSGGSSHGGVNPDSPPPLGSPQSTLQTSPPPSPQAVIPNLNFQDVVVPVAPVPKETDARVVGLRQAVTKTLLFTDQEPTKLTDQSKESASVMDLGSSAIINEWSDEVTEDRIAWPHNPELDSIQGRCTAQLQQRKDAAPVKDLFTLRMTSKSKPLALPVKAGRKDPCKFMTETAAEPSFLCKPPTFADINRETFKTPDSVTMPYAQYIELEESLRTSAHLACVGDKIWGAILRNMAHVQKSDKWPQNVPDYVTPKGQSVPALNWKEYQDMARLMSSVMKQVTTNSVAGATNMQLFRRDLVLEDPALGAMPFTKEDWAALRVAPMDADDIFGKVGADTEEIRKRRQSEREQRMSVSTVYVQPASSASAKSKAQPSASKQQSKPKTPAASSSSKTSGSQSFHGSKQAKKGGSKKGSDKKAKGKKPPKDPDAGSKGASGK